MINLKKISKDSLRYSYKMRNFPVDLDNVMNLYDNYKNINGQLEKLYGKKNTISAKSSEAMELKNSIKELEITLESAKNLLQKNLEQLPNIIHESVPGGVEGSIVDQWKDLIFTKHHYDMPIYEPSSMSRFAILKNQFATLERAIGQFMISEVLKHDFQEYSLPYFMKPSELEKTGHLPKEKDNMFYVEDGFYLIPTSEVSLVSYYANKKLTNPVKITSLTDCFRREAGSSGRDTKGLIRLHQFKKCEMVVITNANESYEMLESMVKISTGILKLLGIPYRIKLLGAEDMGFCSAKTYDLEIPIGNQWREVASLSNCETFQSFGLNIKYDGELAHTLNGSALAVGRTMASLCEVHYDGKKIIIPEPLIKFTNFSEIII